MDRLTATAAALASPARRALLTRLSRGPATVGELARPVRMTQQAVSKHLAYLERARLITKRRVGREHICTLNPEPMKEVAAWVDGFRQFWEESFDRLDGVLREMQAQEESSHE